MSRAACITVAILLTAMWTDGRSGRFVRAQTRALAIHEIQGAGARSPWESAVVVTGGVVTGRKTNGFFLQTTEGAEDANASTSEGIFVFTSTAPAANLTPGTLVIVTGRVLEFVPAADPSSPPLTEIAGSPTVEIRGAGMRLPAAIEIRSSDLVATGGHDQLERLESMRVVVTSAAMVSPTLGTVNEPAATGTSNGVFYVVLSGVDRPFREPGIDVREALPSGSPCCVPRFDGNPERLRVDSDGQPGAAAVNAPAGTIVRNLVGPLDYGFQSYTILPDPATPPSVAPGAGTPLVRAPAEDELAIASFNLQRFFDTTNDPTVGDAVLTPGAFQMRLAKASLHIRQLLRLPAIIGVQEVENLSTLQQIAAALNRDAREARELKPRYEAYLEEGNDPGGIDVGFLVDRARVELLQFTQQGKPEMFRPPGGQAELLNDRPPLVLRARLFSHDTRVPAITIIVNHLRSLIDIESPTAGARVRAKRAAQAEYLAALINRRLSDDPGERILVIGDLNAFEFNDGYVDVVGTLRGAPASRERTVAETRDLLDPDLINLIDLVPADSRYSYVFDGTAQTLDHMLVTGNLVPSVTAFTHVRGNADSPEVWRSDGRRPERISDHDPAIVYLDFFRTQVSLTVPVR
ncbi:MAG: endonuclease/exonuclease/phosphatase family protein [Vicinamibacterales bacterium]